jgi:hypothetical protein
MKCYKAIREILKLQTQQDNKARRNATLREIRSGTKQATGPTTITRQPPYIHLLGIANGRDLGWSQADTAKWPESG